MPNMIYKYSNSRVGYWTENLSCLKIIPYTDLGLPNVSLFVDKTYHELIHGAVLLGIQSAYVNTNGFAIRKKAEIYWGIHT